MHTTENQETLNRDVQFVSIREMYISPELRLNELIRFFKKVHQTWIDHNQKEFFLNLEKPLIQERLAHCIEVNALFRYYRNMLESGDYRMEDKGFLQLKREIRKTAVLFPIEELRHFKTLFEYLESAKNNFS